MICVGASCEEVEQVPSAAPALTGSRPARMPSYCYQLSVIVVHKSNEDVTSLSEICAKGFTFNSKLSDTGKL